MNQFFILISEYFQIKFNHSAHRILNDTARKDVFWLMQNGNRAKLPEIHWNYVDHLQQRKSISNQIRKYLTIKSYLCKSDKSSKITTTQCVFSYVGHCFFIKTFCTLTFEHKKSLKDFSERTDLFSLENQVFWRWWK
jgi:hypothetical protein